MRGMLSIAAATLLLAAPAMAAVKRAETVLPPGQSGFVSVTGLPNGTGSPHLTDQIGLFNSFDYKPAGFAEPGSTQTPKAGVTIVRDDYGVPAITGTTDDDAWWGAGYAVAQDRLFQLELFKRAGAGRLAEILGSEYVDDDLISRRDYYTDPELDQMHAALPEKFKDRLLAYRDGVNAWIDHVGSAPADLPGEFPALGITPGDWTIRDSLRVGILLARTIPSDSGGELANAEALQGIGRRNFDRLLPLRTPGARPTVPASEGSFPSLPGRTRSEARRAFKRSRRFLGRIDFGAVEDTAANPVRAPAGERGEAPGADLRSIVPSPGGSFMWAISDPERERAFLYSGPQLGFTIPQLLVEIEVHSPDLDARGVTAAGVPLVGIGRNARVAWGFTSGTTDDDDLYAERLTGSETYRFRGTDRQMDCRDEQIAWRSSPTGLPDALQALVGGGDPAAGSTTQRICRTVHGPVQASGDGRAFARRYNVWGRELETIVGLTELTEARTIADVDKAMSHVTWNENVIAADSRGHIGYWHPGLLPRRSERFDERLPLPGTGRAEWAGFLRVGERPHAIDPARGWLANWNNVPSRAWTNGDAAARGRETGRFHRVHLLETLVRRAARNPSYGSHKAIVRTSGTTAQALPFLSDRKLRRARRRAGPTAALALDELRSWDGDYHSTDGGGTVAAGVAIFEEFKDRLEDRLLDPMGPEARLIAGEPSLNHQFDTSNGEATALRLLGPRAYAAAMEAAVAALETRFGTPSLAEWREPRRMYVVGAQGAGSSPDIPFVDRGSWEQVVQLGP